MSNPEVFEYSYAWPALYLTGFLALCFAGLVTGGALSESRRFHRAGKRVAYISGGLAAASILVLVGVGFAANSEADAHATQVGAWLEAEYDVRVADGDLETLLDLEAVPATVDGEKRFVALAEDGDYLVPLFESRD